MVLEQVRVEAMGSLDELVVSSHTWYQSREGRGICSAASLKPRRPKGEFNRNDAPRRGRNLFVLPFSVSPRGRIRHGFLSLQNLGVDRNDLLRHGLHGKSANPFATVGAPAAPAHLDDLFRDRRRLTRNQIAAFR